MALVSRADASTLLVQFQFFGVFIVGLPDDGHEVAVKFIVQAVVVETKCDSFERGRRRVSRWRVRNQEAMARLGRPRGLCREIATGVV
jgi:hypothetical protein